MATANSKTPIWIGSAVLVVLPMIAWMGNIDRRAGVFETRLNVIETNSQAWNATRLDIATIKETLKHVQNDISEIKSSLGHARLMVDPNSALVKR